MAYEFDQFDKSGYSHQPSDLSMFNVRPMNEKRQFKVNNKLQRSYWLTLNTIKMDLNKDDDSKTKIELVQKLKVPIDKPIEFQDRSTLADHSYLYQGRDG